MLFTFSLLFCQTHARARAHTHTHTCKWRYFQDSKYIKKNYIRSQKEKAARAAAAAVAAAQNERVSQFAKQIQDLQAQILHEPQDQTVLALVRLERNNITLTLLIFILIHCFFGGKNNMQKSELQKVCKDVKDINAIFCKIGGCPGPYINDSSLHCCAHTVHDPACRKWMKKGDKFQV